MTSFNFSMYFVSVLAKNGHFDHFWDPKWGFTDPLLIYFAHNVLSVSQHIVYDYKNVVCITSFNFSMYFVSVLAKNGHFDPFWDPKWGFTDPLLIFFANNV